MIHAEPSSAKKSFHKTLAEMFAASDKSQREIAHALGYEHANIISMFKSGATRLPPEKVVPLAQLLGHEPGPMLRRWFAAYMPNVLPDIDRHMTASDV